MVALKVAFWRPYFRLGSFGARAMVLVTWALLDAIACVAAIAIATIMLFGGVWYNDISGPSLIWNKIEFLMDQAVFLFAYISLQRIACLSGFGILCAIKGVVR